MNKKEYNKIYYKTHKDEILKRLSNNYWKDPESSRDYQRKKWAKYSSDPNFLKKERLRSKERYRKHLAYYSLRNSKQSKTIEQKSRMKLVNSILTGKIIRPTKCDACNTTAKIEAHHYDGYKNPFKVMWLCKSCHVKLHH